MIASVFSFSYRQTEACAICDMAIWVGLVCVICFALGLCFGWLFVQLRLMREKQREMQSFLKDAAFEVPIVRYERSETEEEL